MVVLALRAWCILPSFFVFLCAVSFRFVPLFRERVTSGWKTASPEMSAGGAVRNMKMVSDTPREGTRSRCRFPLAPGTVARAAVHSPQSFKPEGRSGDRNVH